MQKPNLLTDLPPEIFFNILDYLPTFLSLRGVSKPFLNLITPLAFSEISLYLSEEYVSAQLMLIKSSLCTITSSIRTLHITRGPIVRGQTGFVSTKERMNDAEGCILLDSLAESLAKLQCLETVK